jgi:hypothetical protein
MNKVASINLTEIQHYSQSFARKLTEYYFIDHPTIDGKKILDFCEIKQVNLLIIKILFERWQAETDKLESPFFDYQNTEVKEALKIFHNVLSRHISIAKKHFQPLLTEAVEDTLLLILNPKEYYEQEILKFHGTKIQPDKFSQVAKYIQFNKELFKNFTQKLAGLYPQECNVHDALTVLDDIYKDFHRYVEPMEWRLKSFSDILSLDISKIWKEDASISHFQSSNYTFEALNPQASLEVEPNPQVEIITTPNQVNSVIEDVSLTELESLPGISEDISQEEINFTTESSLPNQSETFTWTDTPSTPEIKQSLTINDSFQSETPTLADTFQQSKIASLREGIPLHQKFSFSNALFKGDNFKFNEAIDKLDDCTSYEEARRLTNQFFLDNNWDFDSEMVQEFLKFVEKRF